MRVAQELACNFAKDAFELTNKRGNGDVIYEMAKALVATSSTMDRVLVDIEPPKFG